MTELFRRLVIKHFQDNKLINVDFARNLLSWKNSGFSIDNSVKIAANDNRARETLAQYILYGVDPLVCPSCGSEMKIIAIIMDKEETTRILEHLIKIGRPPPNFDAASLN
jgi:hypothetical protein